MASIFIDVDLDEFSIGEIITELANRVNRNSYQNISVVKRKLLKNAMKQLNDALLSEHKGIDIKTLDDEQKMNHIIKVFTKYTSAQIESALPE